MYRGPITGTFTTYGIVDPRFSLFVYVGQTCDFERRKRHHLRGVKEGRKRPRTRGENIKTWTFDAVSAGITPVIVPLETVKTWRESLISETEWVYRLAAENHPLLNRWRNHKLIIGYARISKPMRMRTLPANITEFMKMPQFAAAPVFERAADNRDQGQVESKGALKAENHGKTWTESLDQQLVEQFQGGFTIKRLAMQAGRTEFSIRARLLKLGCITETQILPE